MNCPICGKSLEEEDELILKYLPQHDYWITLHLKVDPTQTEVSSLTFAGYKLRCAQANLLKPR